MSDLRFGVVGDKLAAGEVVLTASGRKTSPFPVFTSKSGALTSKCLKSVDAWLISNAIAEAEARGDDFNLTQFKAVNLKNLSQADKDSAELYLFWDEQPAVVPSVLKPLVQHGSSTLAKDSSWVIRNQKTGEVIMETFDKAKVDALNTEKYEAVPVLQYLQELNNKASAMRAC